MLKSPFKAAERLSINNLQAEVGNLLERLWRYGVNTGPLDGHGYAPPIELREEADRYVLTAEVPGIGAESLELSVALGSVTISGEKPRVAETQPDAPLPEDLPRVIQSERRYGDFRRIVAVPGAIQRDNVTAAVKQGVLTVVLPKAGGTAPGEVRVQVQAMD